jgi:hypothetical protein
MAVEKAWESSISKNSARDLLDLISQGSPVQFPDFGRVLATGQHQTI